MNNDLLEAKNIDISFGGIHAVNNLSFQIRKGEILGLIGPNGAGKTTIVNLITGVCKLDDGDIIFDSRSIKKLAIHERARIGIGRTFQSPKPFKNMTVFDCIFTIALQFHNYKDAEYKTLDILKQMEMEKYSDQLSDKLPIEKRKWLDLARVLALEPKLILMDEVMAGLNASEMQESLELAKKINQKGISIMFIEHVMKAVISICDRVIVLNGGMFLAEGAPLEVMKKKEVINAYLGEDYDNASDEES